MSTMNIYIMFNKDFYRQIDALVIESLLSPMLAQVFFTKLRKWIIRKYPEWTELLLTVHR